MKGPAKLQRKSTVPSGGDTMNWGQQYAIPSRPQLPRDYTQMGQPRWETGELPKGAFRTIFDFGEGKVSTKISNTNRPGRKVY